MKFTKSRRIPHFIRTKRNKNNWKILSLDAMITDITHSQVDAYKLDLTVTENIGRVSEQQQQHQS